MSENKVTKSLVDVLFAIPAIIFAVVINVCICFATSGAVLVQLLLINVNKYVSLGVALLVAVVVHFFIMYNHKVWDFIKKQGIKNNE